MGEIEGLIDNSYFDTSTSGISSGEGAQSTSALQGPMDYSGIYAAWNIDVDDADVDATLDTGVDDPWDFGTNVQYPALKVDFDGNDDATAYEFGLQDRNPPTEPAIIDLSAVAGDMQVTLSWTVPYNGGASISAYEIKQAASSGGLPTAPVAIVDVVVIPNGAISGVSVTYIVGSLTNGTIYYFQVAATNSAGTGADSNEAFATPLVPLVPMISFSDLSGSAVDASSGSSAPLDVSLAVSDGGFTNATNIMITVAATTGEIADGDYTLAVKSGSLATLTSANPLYIECSCQCDEHYA